MKLSLQGNNNLHKMLTIHH